MSSAGLEVLSVLPDDPIGFSRSPHCDDSSILIYLSVPGNQFVPLQVLDSDSIASVKLRIQSCKGFVVKKQRLVFDGRELARNDCLVRDYGVGDGNVLHLVLRLSDIRDIKVRTASGKEYGLQVEKSRNVRYIKDRIAREGEEVVDVDEQKLICDGEELDDQRLIDDICKSNDAVIHLLIRKSAKVRQKPVEKDLELSIDVPDVNEKLSVVDRLQLIAREPPDRGLLVEPVIVNSKVVLSKVVRDMIQGTIDGLEVGNLPVMSTEGSGGVYFMQDAAGRRNVAVFKPIDEEPMAENNPRGLPVSVDGEGLKRGTRVGEGALREVAAYILDYPVGGQNADFSDELGFSGVPPTVMVRCLNESLSTGEGYNYGEKNFKVGSLQMFMKNCGSCEDMGPRAFPVGEVHKISVLDIRLANADRHAGNILVCKNGDGEFVLVPIDHGYCLPENFEDCTFEWLYWPQARQPFSSETMDYIRSLNAEQDIALLKFYGWELSLECSRTLRISTMLLKKGAERGMTPYDIGSILCRPTLKKESKIEEIVYEAKDSVLPGTSEVAFLDAVAEIMDRHLDEFNR